MWQNDPFKAKWSILAKAYSIIRESNTKNAAPLDKFLSLTCPLIGVIPRDDYLGVMSWSIVDTAGVKNMERMYTPDISSFPENILTTNLSSEEIVAHCQRVSYVNHNNNDVARNQGSTVALAMAAQPTFASAPEAVVACSHPVSHTQHNHNMVRNSDSAINFASMAAQPMPNDTTSAPSMFNFSDPESPYQQNLQATDDLFVSGLSIQDALNQNNNNAVGASGPVRQAVHNLSNQQYPFMDEFDPFQGSSLDFDPFNMDQDAAFASNSIGTYLAPSNNDFPETFNIDDLLSSDLFDMTE
jgi:hypothetical protein